MRYFSVVCLASIMFTVSAGGAAQTSSPLRLPNISEVGKNLGAQVTRAMMMRSDFGKDRDGRLVMYTVLMGNPAVLVITDAKSAKVLRTHPIPGTSGAWNVMTASNGDVYVGAYNGGLLYRYLPTIDKVENLGFPFKTHDAVLYPTAEGADGKIYGGTYPSGHAYEFDPTTKKFRDLGDMTKTAAQEKWIRVTQYDPATNRLYFGIGNQPQLVEYDLATGKKRDMLPPRYSAITAVYDLSVAGGRLFCRKETSHPNEYFVLNQENGQTVMVHNRDTGETTDTFRNASRGMSPKSPVANKVYYISPDYRMCEYDLDTNSIHDLGVECASVATGYYWAQLDDPAWPGWTLLCTTGNTGGLLRFNPETNRGESQPVDYPGQPINIHDIEHGPDDKIYSGGYLAGNMGVFDPATGSVTYLSGSGQTEGMVFLGKKLFMGIYPGARIYEYNTDLPWTAGGAGGTTTPMNPRRVFSLEEHPEISGYTNQDRPFAMATSEKLQKLIVGTVPKNGMLGGALAVWDVKAGGEPDVYWNLIADQSITALACKDDAVYGGTSIYGGLGSAPKAKEARLFAWDLEKKKLLYDVVPVPGRSAITQLLMRPDGSLWGLAGDTLFVFDPVKKQVTYSAVEFGRPNVMWRDGSLVNGPDGNVYGTMDGKLFKADGKTFQVQFIAGGVDKMSCDNEGRLYTSGSPKTELWQIIPGE